MHVSICILAESKHAFIGEHHACTGVYETGVINISVHICTLATECVCARMYVHIFTLATECVCARMYVRAHTHSVASVKQMCTLMFTTSVSYTHAHAWCSTTPMNACLLFTRMHMDSCMRAYATVQKRLCRGHGRFLTEGTMWMLSVSSLFLTQVRAYGGVCVCIRTHTHTLHRWGTWM